jgi:hypothetical protein
MREKLVTVALYLGLGAAVVCATRPVGEFYNPVFPSEFFPLIIVALLLLGIIRAFFNLRWAHVLGAAAALLTCAPLLWREAQTSRYGVNSWIAFNYSAPGAQVMVNRIAWRTAAVVLSIFVLCYCSLRFMPERWTWRGKAWRTRSWPAFTLTLLFVTCWYGASVSPYRIPAIIDWNYPDYRILHVEKDGLRFHETSISVYRDGRATITRTERRLLQYRSPQSFTWVVLPPDERQAAITLLHAPVLKDLRGRPLTRLRRWRDEGWYIVGGRDGPVGFVSSEGAHPPAEIVDAFRRIEGIPTQGSTYLGEVRDICFGFCYDPKAGLGMIALNDRCRRDRQEKLHCE